VQQEKLIITLFQPWHTSSFTSWLRIRAINDPWRETSDITSTIYYASYDGVLPAVRALVKSGVNVNAQGGRYGHALGAASYAGNEAIVGFLVENGADVNAQHGMYGDALYAASYRGHESVVRLLLVYGADVNAQGGEYGNALQAASY